MQAFFDSKSEDLLLVKLRSHNYCCGKRRQLSGVSYRCRSATCFIQVRACPTLCLRSSVSMARSTTSM
jgi:tRNA uridine 5-carbamoylmethylation protein Kti12